MRQEVVSIGKSFRAIFRERRRFARRNVVCAVRLPVGVSMPNDLIDPEAENYPRPIMGHTRDLSVSGLSLVLPSPMLGDQDISVEGTNLRIVLSLPTGIIVVHAETVRSETLQDERAERLLIGACIVRMYEADRRRYDTFLHELATRGAG